MKKLLLIGALTLFGVASAQHSAHSWLKDSEWEDRNGKIVCVWVCRVAGYQQEHQRTTTGYGYCPYPIS